MNGQVRDSKRVLVCGATGYLGRYVVLAAKRRGHWVRALVRDAARLGETRDAPDDIFVGQATRPDTLAGLCDGVDVVISSLGNHTFKRKPSVWEVDFGANANLLSCAESASVQQFIFVSVLHGDRMRAHVPQAEARERVVDALRAGSVGWTIVRPSGFFNDMGDFLDMARQRGVVWLPGTGEARFNPIHGADLANAIVDLVGDAGALGIEYPVGGPDVLSGREVAEIAFDLLGKPVRTRSLPAWVMNAGAAVVRPFNENLSSFVAMLSNLASGDAVAPCHGDHHLRDFFSERLAAQPGGDPPAR